MLPPGSSGSVTGTNWRPPAGRIQMPAAVTAQMSPWPSQLTEVHGPAAAGSTLRVSAVLPVSGP